MARIDSTNNPAVTAIVIQRMRIAATSVRRNMRMTPPGSGCGLLIFSDRRVRPISGAKTTATNHEAISAIATTANIENVYSPAALLAKAACKADRHKSGNRHESAGEHRKG